MQINPSIFKAYDIRGVYPQEINEENIEIIILAIYTFFVRDLKKQNLHIVLGRDMRVSSPSLFEKAKNVLLELGATVIDAGLVSTPTFYFAILDNSSDAGIQISASHNPKEYNGIKFAKRVGKSLVKIGKTTGMEEIKKLVESQNFIDPQDGGRVIEKHSIVKDEVEMAFKKVHSSGIKKMKVVADPGNAMGALYIEELFRNLPCELIKMNFELDGTFPSHQPDPLQFDTLKELQKRVITEKADLGIAPDGDGDRVFFIDERGEVIPATLISSLIAQEVLKKTPNQKVIVDIRYTRNVEHTVQKNNGKISISKVGHALITEQLNNEGAVFAGESSGHFYFKETGGAESSVLVILYVLEAMSREGKLISDIVSQLSTSYESGEMNFVLPDLSQAKTILKEIANMHNKAEISWLDGLDVSYPRWRFNIRTSNTEPLIRLNLEAVDQKTLRSNLAEIVAELEQKGAVKK